MKKHITKAMREGIFVIDGAMGTAVQAMQIDIERDYIGRENCTDVLTRSRPDLVRAIHTSFLEVGVDAVETNTFGANRLVLSEFDEELATWAFDLNKESAQLAVEACSRVEGDRYVLGSMGPGTKLISLGQTTWDNMLDSYTEQARGLLEGGVDAFIIETCQDILQVKCAINACLDALTFYDKTTETIPILVSITIETTGTMLVGSDLQTIVHALAPYPIFSLGLNCATGPELMEAHIAWLSENWSGEISVVPNAGLPEFVSGCAHFPLSAHAYGMAMKRFVEKYGVRIIGGCCGTTPKHLASFIDLKSELHVANRTTKQLIPSSTSLFTPVEFKQDTSILIVAERTNANGSRKFKRLLEEEQWDGLVDMAREELSGGAHVLDVCVDYVGRDGVADLEKIVGRLAQQVDAPLMLDSTDAIAIEAGLKRAGGRCIVNSINLEDGEKRLDDICPLLKKFGAAAVALTIDEEGMAKTASRKVEIAKRLHSLYTEKWGLKSSDLLIDVLTFTIATGMESDRKLALETLDAIEMISIELPECGLLLGVSNVSFGLKPSARRVLNSVFLHEAIQRGLTSAIVHASKILPKHRIDEHHWAAAIDLIYDNRTENKDPLLYFLSLFETDVIEEDEDQIDRSLEEQLRSYILDGKKEGLQAVLEEALKEWSALTIINDHLLDGMKTVGELFGSGQMQLPFVLQSAEVMKKAVGILEPHMEKGEVIDKGRIVLATVSGDVHDIGKNLVDIILSNNGYTVFNIGIRQKIEAIIEAATIHKADAIGLSGLLVKSVGVMEQNLHELNTKSISIPVLLGGAALTRHWAESHLRTIYNGPLYYGRDAFEALSVCDKLVTNQLCDVDEQIEARLKKRAEVEAKVQSGRTDRVDKVRLDESHSLDVVAVPSAPFFGSKMETEIDLDLIYPYINKTALFRGQWGFKKGALSRENFDNLVEETVEPIFERLKKWCKEENVLRPKVVYGWWPCASDGDDVVIYDSEDHDKEIARYAFPRQSKRARRCLSDFFKPINCGERDVIGMSCVTVGDEISRRTRDLFDKDEYTEYLYLHGIGVECAEALAEYWHKKMRIELGIAGDDKSTPKELFAQGYQGSRYSFGYPACPEMEKQEIMFKLLEPDRIGCTLTESWEIVPEQSTSAIIVHHHQAKYFSAK
ncbi:MAG TPA: methionine synthase [Phycisphaerales bacterium]|nr:methionine synthase [Phycisphaerales bacterium]